MNVLACVSLESSLFIRRSTLWLDRLTVCQNTFLTDARHQLDDDGQRSLNQTCCCWPLLIQPVTLLTIRKLSVTHSTRVGPADYFPRVCWCRTSWAKSIPATMLLIAADTVDIFWYKIKTWSTWMFDGIMCRFPSRLCTMIGCCRIDSKYIHCQEIQKLSSYTLFNDINFNVWVWERYQVISSQMAKVQF